MKNTDAKTQRVLFHHPARANFYRGTICSKSVVSGHEVYEIQYIDEKGQGYVSFIEKKHLIFLE